VKKIPPDMPAVGGMKEGLTALGKRVAAERARERRAQRWRSLRVVLVAGGVGLTLAVGATATSDFLVNDGPRGDRAPSRDRPLPAELDASLALARDPVERRYPWAIRTYPSRKGECILAGRLVDGRIGRLIDGKFSPFENSLQGLCGDMRKDHIVFSTRTYCQYGGGRTLLYGVTDRQVASLSLLAPGSSTPRRLRIADDGSFIGVRRGPGAYHRERLRIDFVYGGSRLIPLQPLRLGCGRPARP
jgi:hypothetical protein